MALNLAPIKGGWERAEMQHPEYGHDAVVILSTAEGVRQTTTIGSVVGDLNETLFSPDTRKYFSNVGVLRYLAGIELGPRLHDSKTAEHVRWLQPPYGRALPTPEQLFDAPNVKVCELGLAGPTFPSFASWLIRVAPVTLETPTRDPRVRFLNTIKNA